MRFLLAALLMLIASGILIGLDRAPCAIASASESPTATQNCPSPLFVHHDYSYEMWFCWNFGQSMSPYYGAWAEAFDLGPGTIECGTYWFSQAGLFVQHYMDVYVWEAGVSRPPGNVLYVRSVLISRVDGWPMVTEIDEEIGCEVAGEFTLGYWADFSNEVCGWFTLFDCDSPDGHPWTCVAPGLGLPTGWNNPEIVGTCCNSLGIGVHFAAIPSDATGSTWGEIKSLYR